MKPDEQAIRELVEAWMTASKSGDLATVLSLMADDVIFMVPGKEPFGKEAFAASSKTMKDVSFEGRSDIQELEVLGEWAWMRNRLEVTVTLPNNAKPTVLSGYTLTIFHRNSNGSWVIARDANLLTPQT